jgi:hypothetical protein
VIDGRAITGRGEIFQPPTDFCTATLAAWDFPEAVCWTSHLMGRARAAEPFRTQMGMYAIDHVRAIQRSSIPVDAEYVQQLLVISADTKAAIDDLRQTGADDLRIAEVVPGARASLIRSMPAPVWILVNRDAHRARDGGHFCFPSSVWAQAR